MWWQTCKGEKFFGGTMLPTSIRSVVDFHAAVQLGSTPESLVIEFKSKINGWNAPNKEPKEKAQKETCRDIAQFANTLGGCLVIGVASRVDPARKVNVAEAIIPVNDVEKLWAWIEQAIVNYLVPATFTHDVVAITLPEGNILAVNVPASRHLVSLWDRERHTIECVRRTSYGKEWMNPDEMERHLMDGSRAAKLALIAAKEQAKDDQVEIVGGLWLARPAESHMPVPWGVDKPITLGQMEEYWFQLRIELSPGHIFPVTIPYSFVQETWVNQAGMVALLLTVRIIGRVGASNTVDRATLDPYSG
jgi:hypothetical protein